MPIDLLMRCFVPLRISGVEEYGKVAIIANNRWEWAAIACAAYSINATLVPMYEAQLPADWTYILNDSGSSVVFCANQDIFDRVQRDVLPSTPAVKASLCLDAPEGEPHAFSTAMSRAQANDSLIVKPTEDDLCNLIYTSGTTGKPKGVELTHLNFASNVKAAGRSMVEDPTQLVRQSDRSLAFLPWAHS
jgi:long-chain acyl-CoA synthetase